MTFPGGQETEIVSLSVLTSTRAVLLLRLLRLIEYSSPHHHRLSSAALCVQQQLQEELLSVPYPEFINVPCL